MYDPTVPLVVGAELEKFSTALLSPGPIRKSVELIERLLGRHHVMLA